MDTIMRGLYSSLTITAHTDDGYTRALGTPVDGKGFIQPTGGGENFDHMNLTAKVDAILYTDVSTSINFGDIITQNSKAYVVLWSEQPNGISGTQHHKEILLGKVQG